MQARENSMETAEKSLIPFPQRSMAERPKERKPLRRTPKLIISAPNGRPLLIFLLNDFFFFFSSCKLVFAFELYQCEKRRQREKKREKEKERERERPLT